MHELSIAYRIVQTVEKAAIEASISRVDAVHVQVGLLSGVVKDALQFSYEIAVQGTCLEGSQLRINETPVVIYCPVCQKTQTLPSIQRFRCPDCDTPSADIRQGKEIEITGLEVFDEAETTGT